MSGAALIGIVLLVFFVAGITAGVVAVVAMPARRTRTPPGYGWPEDGDEKDRADDLDPDTGSSGDSPRHPPYWPG